MPNRPLNIRESRNPPHMNKNQPTFKFAELFAGIGGVSFGLERLGGHCLLAAEFDPTSKGKRQFAQDAYKLLHPETEVRGDVYEIDENDVPEIDVLSFTTPCQAFSINGQRKGFEDTRGTLIFEALRIANKKRPAVLFMENVKGLISHDEGNTLETILSAMNEIGYCVDFKILNSKNFGVAQSRERIFIVGVRKDLIETEIHNLDDVEKQNYRNQMKWRDTGTTTDAKTKRRLAEENQLDMFNFDWPEKVEVTTQISDFLENEIDTKHYYKQHVDRITRELNELRPVYTEDAKKGILQMGMADFPGHAQLSRIYSPEGICPTITTMGGGNTHPKIAEKLPDGTYRIRRLTPRECMRLQAFPDAATDILEANKFSDSRIYKFAGNAVTTSVITAIGKGFKKYIELARAKQENTPEVKTGTNN